MTATDTNNNPWVVQSTKQSAPVPDNSYIAKFEGVADYSHVNLDGGKPKWKWLFKVIAGEHAGKAMETITDPAINPNTQAGRLIRGLLGRDIQAGENVKAAVDACSGKTYLTVFGRGPQGGKSAVRHVGPVPEM